ncbi:response regulator transcription factor [Mesorhizobium sp. INR15]|uniref:response regulator transcription factor n=1 Tax=Mesorhizobium sp. INR15 TaxID=2654248 RepID=UPI0018965AA6|nr:response regulator transcription factor [Mesorhizobium sp. INR15]QPC89868.1 response regulator [Mesorhizobium sp. INR15]
MRIMLVEDEREMANALCSVLAKHDMLVDHVMTIGAAMEAVQTFQYDAILLDRQLPDGDGLTLLPKLRERGMSVPVIVLTAKGDLADRVIGLDTGADDYLAKPFALEELLARLRAVMRRPSGIAEDMLRLGQLTFDFGNRQAMVADQVMPLRRRELLVLEALAKRRGRTVLRSVLEEAVYSFDDEIQSNALDTHVSRLRKKLTEAGAGVEIHPVRGVGYLMKRAS